MAVVHYRSLHEPTTIKIWPVRLECRSSVIWCCWAKVSLVCFATAIPKFELIPLLHRCLNWQKDRSRRPLADRAHRRPFCLPCWLNRSTVQMSMAPLYANLTNCNFYQPTQTSLARPGLLTTWPGPVRFLEGVFKCGPAWHDMLLLLWLWYRMVAPFACWIRTPTLKPFGTTCLYCSSTFLVWLVPTCEHLSISRRSYIETVHESVQLCNANCITRILFLYKC